MSKHRPWLNFDERVKDQPLTEKCFKCHKAICYEEWTTCWGSCDACLSASLDEYEREKREHARESTY